jgi:RNA polymerase sigma-70 factor (ECF subfamily)
MTRFPCFFFNATIGHSDQLSKQLFGGTDQDWILPGGAVSSPQRRATVMKGSGNSLSGEPEGWPSSTSLTLLDRVKQRDQHGAERLVKLFQRLVVWWCRRKGLDEHDSEDVAQEVFKTVFEKIDRFTERRGRGSFRAWLRAITQNKLREFHDRRRKQPAAIGGSQGQDIVNELPDAPPDESSADATSERIIVVRDAMALVRSEFEPKTWNAAWATAVEGKRAADVAADLGMTRDAVYIAKSRVLSRLRQEMSTLLD